jgi:hypothetical protein
MFGVRLLALLSIGCCVHGAPEDIYLSNGGYRGILLAIDENVPYDANILPNLRVIVQMIYRHGLKINIIISSAERYIVLL